MDSTATVPRKTGKLTEAEQAVYDRILSQIPAQRNEYQKYLDKVLGRERVEEQVAKARKWGFKLDITNGHLKYAPDFEPLQLPYEVTYVRHGKTEGNTEPRIYQGDVDYWENQLTDVGRRQAAEAADKLDQKMQKENWKCDLIVLSPLTRACDTAKPFIDRHPEIKVEKNAGTKEMAFGDWDNVRVIDVPDNSIAHLFYLEQNALIRAKNDHEVKDGFAGRSKGDTIPAETFVDVIDRMATALLNIKPPANASGNKPSVLFFGHSMAGAALSMLRGHGKQIADAEKGALGFDGKYIMPNATPTDLPAQNPF